MFEPILKVVTAQYFTAFVLQSF